MHHTVDDATFDEVTAPPKPIRMRVGKRPLLHQGDDWGRALPPIWDMRGWCETSNMQLSRNNITTTMLSTYRGCHANENMWITSQ